MSVSTPPFCRSELPCRTNLRSWKVAHVSVHFFSFLCFERTDEIILFIPNINNDSLQKIKHQQRRIPSPGYLLLNQSADDIGCCGSILMVGHTASLPVKGRPRGLSLVKGRARLELVALNERSGMAEPPIEGRTGLTLPINVLD
jgi:hypothetical protein